AWQPFNMLIVSLSLMMDKLPKKAVTMDYLRKMAFSPNSTAFNSKSQESSTYQRANTEGTVPSVFESALYGTQWGLSPLCSYAKNALRDKIGAILCFWKR